MPYAKKNSRVRIGYTILKKYLQGWHIYSIFQDPEVVLPSKIDFTYNLLQLESSGYETNPVWKKAN